MTIMASYLPLVGEGERNPSDYVPELSRRARGFPTWAMIRHLGRQGIASMVERHCRLARRIAEGLASEPGVQVVNETVLNQIILRFGADEPPEVADDSTSRTIQRIQADGTCFMGGARWRDRWVMRVSVISATTTDADADRMVEAVRRTWNSGSGTRVGIAGTPSSRSSHASSMLDVDRERAFRRNGSATPQPARRCSRSGPISTPATRPARIRSMADCAASWNSGATS